MKDARSNRIEGNNAIVRLGPPAQSRKMTEERESRKGPQFEKKCAQQVSVLLRTCAEPKQIFSNKIVGQADDFARSLTDWIDLTGVIM